MRVTKPSMTDDFSSLPLESLYGFVMDSSDSYLGWGLDSTESDHMNTLNTHAPNTPPANWFTTNALDPEAFLGQASEFNRGPVPHTSPSSHPIARDAQPADSPWVS
jgi:hypothetical protein